MISQLTRAAARLETDTKKQLLISGFDDLNVMWLVDKLYVDIDRVFRQRCKELFYLRYWEVRHWLGTDDEDEIDELFEMYLAGLLGKPNEVLHYTYDTELLRKRDRMKEAIIAVPTKAQKQIEMDKQLRFLLQMMTWFVDFVSQDAEIQAMIDEGVREVERHEMKDSKTCRPCRDADGEIYPIDEIPPLPHPRCRRWFTPA